MLIGASTCLKPPTRTFFASFQLAANLPYNTLLRHLSRVTSSNLSASRTLSHSTLSMASQPRRGVPRPKIAPSMLSSDFADLANEGKRMIQLGADYLHMDVMDG